MTRAASGWRASRSAPAPRYVEKHLTTALALREVDFDAALGPDEFGDFVRAVRDAAAAIGARRPHPAEDFGMSYSEAGYRTRAEEAGGREPRPEAGTELGLGDVDAEAQA